MNIQEFYNDLSLQIEQGRLELSPDICENTFAGLFFAAGVITIENCSVKLMADQVLITGNCALNGWGGDNREAPFLVTFNCYEKEDRIEYFADFTCDMRGTLQDFFGNVEATRITEDSGMQEDIPLIEDFPIIEPVLSFDSTNRSIYFPFTIQAKTKDPSEFNDKWNIYDTFLIGISTLSGQVDERGRFELEVPVGQTITGLFGVEAGVSILLHNGIEDQISLYPIFYSQAGLKLYMDIPKLGKVDFTLPLYTASSMWNLHALFPEGMGISDIVNFLLELFDIGGSLSRLCLPTDAAINQFKLYEIDLQVDRENENKLVMDHLLLTFALANPWKLPVPYVTLESLDVGFEVTFGRGHEWGNLWTASAGGRLSIEFGKSGYKLTMTLEMDLPSLDFMAQTVLSKRNDEEAIPGLVDMAQTFDVSLPQEWSSSSSNNVLGEITVWGSGGSRDFSIEAKVNDFLSFSVGDLEISMAELQAGASASTSNFTFYVQGVTEFGKEDDKFSIYLKAAYENPGWYFAGGLYQGEINIGKLVSQLFQIQQKIPDDVISLSITELEVSYRTQTGEFSVTGAFEAAWEISLLGKPFKLGGRVAAQKTQDKETDVSALAYINISDFNILVQVDHIQSEQREFLFRLEYDKLYLQAMWFKRQNDEILSVSLGGMTLGGLVESLINKINPNKRYTLSKPWNILNGIELSRFLLELNVTKNEMTFIYQASLDIAGLMKIDTVGIRYDMNNRSLYFVLTGELLGISYGKDGNEPLSWDAIDGQPPENSAEDERKFALSYLGMGQHLKNDGVGGAGSIEAAMQALKEQINPSSVDNLEYDAGTNWLFGTDFTVNGMLHVQIVLNDPILYGLHVAVKANEGSALAFFDGFGLDLMCKRVTSQTYMFRGELLVPERFRKFDLGALSITLGTISAEVYTNGGFNLDLGFPHNMDFSLSFVLQWSIFTGRGGFYFGILKDVPMPNLPQTTKGNFSPIVRMGIGLSVGLGRSFDFGIVKGGVSLEVFGILEGVFAIFHDKSNGKEDIYYYVKAVAGVMGRLYLSVDFKIITVQASAEVNASAALTVQAYRESVVEVALSLKVQASIKILFIKINFSFSFNHNASFVMGSNERAPWDEDNRIDTLNAMKVSSLQRTNSLQVCVLYDMEEDKKQIELEIVPMLYRARPVLNKEAKKEYGAAFLMMMDEEALCKWTDVMTDWVLLHLPEDTVTNAQAEDYLEGLERSLTYEVLTQFLGNNVSVSFHIHWVEQENAMRAEAQDKEVSEAEERFVFPMLPAIQLSFGAEETEENAETVNYWTDMPVDESYFETLTDYFSRLNPDPSYQKEESYADEERLNSDAINSDESIPIAKAFFLDYFQMFLKEIIGRVRGFFEQFETGYGIKSASDRFGLPVEELLRQNQNILFKEDIVLHFDKLAYTILENDTLQSIGQRYGYIDGNSADRINGINGTDSILKMWNAVKGETFLLRIGSSLPFGSGSFDNSKAQFTLEEAAALLFVRFFEEQAPSDLFYAGDIARINGVEAAWEETIPNGNVFVLPGTEIQYHTQRGDTPERIGSFLNLLKADKEKLPEWNLFYTDILNRNQMDPGDKPDTVAFYVETVTIRRDLNLADLANRIYPDREESNTPWDRLFTAGILQSNSRIALPDASYTIKEKCSVSELIGKVPCSLEELGYAVADSDFDENQELTVAKASYAGKSDIRDIVTDDAKLIGTTLSRFLMQGLRVPDPACGNLEEAEMIPLYQALMQMFELKDEGKNMILTASTEQAADIWVVQDRVQMTMLWDDIFSKLPSGDFSKIPGAFLKQPDFIPTDQQFSMDITTPYYRGEDCFTVHRLPQAVENILHSGRTAPKILDENGIEENVSWGCLIPIVIGKCEEEGIFTVYGADADKRLILYHLLHVKETVSVRFLYQASKLSKGGENFREYQWDSKDSYLVKTNLSVETHMDPVRYELGSEREAEQEYIVNIDRSAEVLRLLWECSTVGGSGYYIQLKAQDDQTLPSDIFEENGEGILWLLTEHSDYTVLSDCVNCCVAADTLGRKKSLRLVTTDPAQQMGQPVFPAGCIGLITETDVPEEEDMALLNGRSLTDEEKADVLTRSMFQIVGYQLKEAGNDTGKESWISAPVLPMDRKDKKDGKDKWVYQPVIPVYRFASQDGDGTGNDDENPYAAVGKGNKIVLELRDILGNTLNAGETEVISNYNDVLIGVGQWPAVSTSYVITGSVEKPELRITFTYVEADYTPEQIAYQKKAIMQFLCEDIEARLYTSVNGQTYPFSQIMDEKSGKTYLALLKDYMTNVVFKQPGNNLELHFPLRTDEGHMISDEIFELQTKITLCRSDKFAKEEEAKKAESVIWPDFGGDTQEDVKSFCKEAKKVLPELLFAQTAEGGSVLYAVTYGKDRFLEPIQVSLYDYESIQAPEFYALRPLCNGFMNRQALIHGLNPDYTLSDVSYSVNMPDVDMEIWAKGFLADIETLLLPAKIQKAVSYCSDFRAVNRLVAAKEKLACAIAEQMEPLREGGAPAGSGLKEKIEDRLKHSLIEGYSTDIAAGCKLDFAAKEYCRISAQAKSGMPGTQITAGKLEAANPELYLFFTNQFAGRSIPFQTDLVLPELEYDITKEGPDQKYESSKWLRFVEPMQLGLESPLQLPNPLKSCPVAPKLTGHTCEIVFTNLRARWNYCLTGKYSYREQDTIYIEVIFKNMDFQIAMYSVERDLFDVLSEYSVNREQLMHAITEGEGEGFSNAYESFVSIAADASGVWEKWIRNDREKVNNRSSEETLKFSCMVEGREEAGELCFEVIPTKEGEKFLEYMRSLGIETVPAFELAENDNLQEEKEFRFSILNLPIFQCAQAEPSVKAVRNQNLLTYEKNGQKRHLPVNENFIYRTQSVSLPALSVSGEKTVKDPIMSIPAAEITIEEMKQAVRGILEALELINQNIMTGLSVSYYYGLSKGKENPRVMLPSAMVLPENMGEDKDAEKLINALSAELFDWYQGMRPDGNRCGLQFDVKIYDHSVSRQILHFTDLKTAFEIHPVSE